MNKFKISRKGSAVICMIFSAFCFALMNMFVKLSGDIPTMQKSFFRNAVAFAIALIMLLRQGGGFKPHKGCVPLLLGRSICGTIGIFCNFYALGRIVLSDASMLNKLSPFFAVLFSLVFLKEKLKAAQVVFVTTAFLGSLLTGSRSRLHNGEGAFRKRRKRLLYRFLLFGFFLPCVASGTDLRIQPNDIKTACDLNTCRRVCGRRSVRDNGGIFESARKGSFGV